MKKELRESSVSSQFFSQRNSHLLSGSQNPELLKRRFLCFPSQCFVTWWTGTFCGRSRWVGCSISWPFEHSFRHSPLRVTFPSIHYGAQGEKIIRVRRQLQKGRIKSLLTEKARGAPGNLPNQRNWVLLLTKQGMWVFTPTSTLFAKHFFHTSSPFPPQWMSVFIPAMAEKVPKIH